MDPKLYDWSRTSLKIGYLKHIKINVNKISRRKDPNKKYGSDKINGSNINRRKNPNK